MKRWVITQNGQCVGQGASGHKAVDILRRQTAAKTFVVDVLGNDCFSIQVIGRHTYLIRLEHIN